MAITALATSAFAQGTVVLGNETGLVQQWTSAADSTLISVPKGGGYVELLAASTSTPSLTPLFTAVAGGNFANYTTLSSFLSANPGWAPAANASGVGTPGLIGLAAGLFADGNYTINNIAEAANAEYAIVGWTGTYTSLDAAIAAGSGMAGISSIYTTATSDTVGTPSPPLPVNLRSTFGGMTLAPLVIPEPTSFALAGLGLAALLVFRRRN